MSLTRAEIDQIKAAVRIEDVAARYAPSMRRVGERLVGLCPFHDDTEPSLNIWPGSQSWYCFGACRTGGDVIDFLEEAEGIGFAEALERLEREADPAAAAVAAGPRGGGEAHAMSKTSSQEEPLDAEEQAILNAAAEIYYHTLMTNRRWRGWVVKRGVSLETMRHFHVGYSSGRRLMGYLAWRRLSLEKASKLGLHCDGREHLRYRIVVPVMESWRTPFLIGRATREWQKPKYLGLARPKVPLVDVGHGGQKKSAIVVEGPFDLMVLHEWGYHERFDLVSLLGTGVKRGWLPLLERYEQLVVATDQDEAGIATAEELEGRLPGHVVRARWSAEYEDVGALGQVGGGKRIWAAALEEAMHREPARPGVRTGQADVARRPTQEPLAGIALGGSELEGERQREFGRG